MNLTDHFLIATPGSLDPVFGGSVIYLCEHNEFGALGIVINKPIDVKLTTLLEKQNLTIVDEAKTKLDIPVMFGGPMQGDRGFILHTSDATYNATLKISDKIAFTSSRDVLEAIANNTGPRHSLVAIGYAGWDAGQLEKEINKNAWLIIKADADLIFNMPIEKRYNAAIHQLGFEPSMWVASENNHLLQ